MESFLGTSFIASGATRLYVVCVVTGLGEKVAATRAGSPW
jgi:hypothetical protein